MNKFMFCGLLVTLFLTGCNDKVYDSDYYFSNQTEAKDIIEQCKVGKITNKNCDNAKEAIQKQSRLDWIKNHEGKQ